MSSPALCWHAPGAHIHVYAHVHTPWAPPEVCDGWMGRDAVRIRGARELGEREWNSEGRRRLQGGTGQFLERLCVGKLRSYFHATLSYTKRSTMGLCSDRRGSPLLWRLIINAMALLPNTAFHRLNLDSIKEEGRQGGGGDMNSNGL